MKFDFTDKIVIITGATKGIGQSIAHHFKNLGAELILTGTKKEEIDRLNESSDPSGKVKYYYLDFLNDVSVVEFVKCFQQRTKIDILVNNAGINKIEYIYNFDNDDWENIIKVNLTGPFRLIKEVGKIMKEQKYGKIINIASIFGTITMGRRNAYTASKSGLIGLTKTVSVDLAPYNVLVNAVSPGIIETSLTRQILKENEIIELSSEVPLGRLGQPEEIAKLVLFLTSEYNTYITGQNIIIDGGYVNI